MKNSAERVALLLKLALLDEKELKEKLSHLSAHSWKCKAARSKLWAQLHATRKALLSLKVQHAWHKRKLGVEQP